MPLVNGLKESRLVYERGLAIDAIVKPEYETFVME